MKILKNLDNIKIENITKIKKIPDIEKLNIDGKKIYGIKYFLFSDKFSRRKPIVIRITSIDNTFKNPYSIDIFNERMTNYVSVILKPDIPEKYIILFISNLPTSVKYKNIKSTIGTYLEQLTPEKFMLYSTVAQGLILLTTIFLLIRFYIIKILNKIEEEKSAGPREQEINNELFKNQKENEPAFKMYSKLQNFIKYVALGKAPAVILCGPPGMSKTYIVRRTFHFSKLVPGKDYAIEKGSSLSVLSTYDLLYKNRNRILVLDDFDTPLRNEDTVNLLKAITDSYDKRILSLPREKMMSTQNQEAYQTPEKFEYKGKLIIITNLKKSEIDRALLSRAPAFEVNFNTKEVLNSLNDLIDFVNPSVPINIKVEVLNYILELYRKNPKIQIDFRSFKNSIDARVGNELYWKEMVHTIVGL